MTAASFPQISGQGWGVLDRFQAKASWPACSEDSVVSSAYNWNPDLHSEGFLDHQYACGYLSVTKVDHMAEPRSDMMGARLEAAE